MANNIQIVGGERSGEYIKWFGNRVRIQGVEHTLYRVIFTDGSRRKFYAQSFEQLFKSPDMVGVRSVEYVG